jgi:hypothetical protein
VLDLLTGEEGGAEKSLEKKVSQLLSMAESGLQVEKSTFLSRISAYELRFKPAMQNNIRERKQR